VEGDKSRWGMTGGGGREEETNFEMIDVNAITPESCFVKRVYTKKDIGTTVNKTTIPV
jgi:hypothetical protein